MNGKVAMVAVVTGGHSYDCVGFRDLFHGLDGIRPYVQHMDDFASSPDDVRDAYDAVVFYTMLTETPTNEGLPWFAGRPRAALEHLGSTSQGIVVLHHALLAYPDWPLWSELVGIESRSFGFHPEQTLHIEIADPVHPITRGIAGWDMVDETYTMADAGPDSHILLTTSHPKSMRTIAWTRTHQKSRVVCLESGHDSQTWQDVTFQEVLRRSMLWASGKLQN